MLSTVRVCVCGVLTLQPMTKDPEGSGRPQWVLAIP